MAGHDRRADDGGRYHDHWPAGDPARATWTCPQLPGIISFLLVITLLATQVGRLGDVRLVGCRDGLRRLRARLAGLRAGLNELSIIFRILQGVGGAFIILTAARDRRPVRASCSAPRLHLVGWTMGAIIGIALGGVIVTYISWRWISDQRAGRRAALWPGHQVLRQGRTFPAAPSTCPA
jgi:MFS family permease